MKDIVQALYNRSKLELDLASLVRKRNEKKTQPGTIESFPSVFMVEGLKICSKSIEASQPETYPSSDEYRNNFGVVC